MTEELTGRIYDIQPFSVHDGPGIRTTVFLKGCPLRCPWCHSPESQAFCKQLSNITMRCDGTEACGERCIKACPNGALEKGSVREQPSEDGTSKFLQTVHVKRDLCDNCGACAEVCYSGALTLVGEDYTVDELARKACRDKAYFKKSGGGVTISGGEALSQPKFTLALLKELKDRGINTALDTTGFAKWEIIEPMLPYVDLFLLDLKHMDNEKHLGMVKVPCDIIHENARKIAAAGGKFQIRIPVIPLFNDDEENIRATAAFCRELGDAVETVQLLPYHNLGVAKYLRISDNPAFEATPPSDKKMQKLKGIMEEYGLNVVIH